MCPDMLSGRAVAVPDRTHAPVLCRCSRFEATRPARFPLFPQQMAIMANILERDLEKDIAMVEEKYDKEYGKQAE